MLTDADRLVLGTQAELILQNEGFMDCISEIEREYTAAILNTGLSHKELREQMYLTIHGLRLFLASLKKYSTDKQSVLDMNEAAHVGEHSVPTYE